MILKAGKHHFVVEHISKACFAGDEILVSVGGMLEVVKLIGVSPARVTHSAALRRRSFLPFAAPFPARDCRKI